MSQFEGHDLMPLAWLVGAIRPHGLLAALQAAAALRYREALIVMVILRPRISCDDNWLYFRGPDLQGCCIQNLANW